MKMGFKAALGALLVALLLSPSLMWAQKGQKGQPPNQPTELVALFRDNWDSNTQTYGDKIHSDGFGPYMTVENPDRTYDSIVLLSLEGSLGMRVLKNRRVFFEFDAPVRPAPLVNGMLTCRESLPDGSGALFYVSPPSFLTGVPDNDSFYLSTLHEMTYNGTTWVYDVDSPHFDFRTMPVDATASLLVRANFGFYTAEDSGLFIVAPNWPASAASGGGAVKVTHPSADVWIVEPQSAPLPGDPPLRGLGLNEAGFKIQAPAVKKVHGPGACDLGDWVMPFQITLSRR
jgi:hypothetical protein